MINSKLKLTQELFEKEINKKSTRDGYGEGLVESGKKDERVVVLCADLTESTRSDKFKKEFPDRFIEVGVAEQNLATLASGMANYGKIPFISSYAVFSPGRNWEQIRTTICLNDVPVKIAGAHTGVSVGPDGATHQALEDIALMRVLPNMVVIAPCDAIETKKAVIAVAQNGKPTYIRFTKVATPVITTEETPFEIGKANVLWDSVSDNKEHTTKNKVAIVAVGPLLHEALLAAKDLDKEGIGTVVVNNHTIKPMDGALIIEVARKCGAVVTVEEHQVAGGMGSAVAEVLAKNYPVPVEFVGVNDSFGESGKPNELLEKYQLKSSHVIKAVRRVLERKSN